MTRHVARARQPRIQLIGDGPFFAEIDTPRSSSARAAGAAVLAAGLVFSGWAALLSRTDQSGVYLPPDGPAPYPAQPGFGDPVAPNFGKTLVTLALLREKFPDLAKVEFPDFAPHAPPNTTALFDFVQREVPDVTMAEIQLSPQQVVPVTSTPKILPPNVTEVEPLYASSPGGGGGLAPTPQTPPAPNLQNPPVPKLNLPQLPDIPQPDIPQLPVPRLPGTPRLDQQSSQEDSAENSQTGSGGTPQPGSTGTPNGATSQGGSGDSSKGSGDGSKKPGDASKKPGDGSKGSGDASNKPGEGSKGSGDGSKKPGDDSKKPGDSKKSGDGSKGSGRSGGDK